VQAQGFVDVQHDRVWDDAKPVTDPLDGDRSDLLGCALESRSRPVWTT